MQDQQGERIGVNVAFGETLIDCVLSVLVGTAGERRADTTAARRGGGEYDQQGEILVTVRQAQNCIRSIRLMVSALKS